MLSTRVAVLLVGSLALALAAPAEETATDKKTTAVPRPIVGISDDEDSSSWFNWPGFSQLFGPLWQLFPNFEDIGPKIVGDDGKFQVIVRVKDFDKDDLKVKVKNGFLFMQGSHESSGQTFDILANQFFHTYSLPQNSSAEDVTADLYENGYLVVTAPLKGPADRANEKEREVPINVIKENFTAPGEPTQPSLGSNEDRREPTTPPTDDKENKIEHGP